MKFLAVYASLGQVQRVKQRLYAGGVYADMIRAPQRLAARGCSFALRCDPELLAEIRRVSRELSIEIRGVYAESPEGYSALP